MKGKWIQIKKRGGGMRRIYVPSPDEKKAARELLPTLNRAYLDLCRKLKFSDAYIVVHGFRPNHSPVTNALCHIPYHITITVDLENFFDTCTREMFERVLDKMPPRHRKKIEPHLDLLFPGGIAAQGMPTSPMISNLVFIHADKKLHALSCRKGGMYTRYADDMAFSLNDEEEIAEVIDQIRKIVEDSGFKINDKKTKIQSSHNGRRVICGVAVDAEGLHAPRWMRRRLRAARHQGNEAHARGLAEWCAMKIPPRYLQLIINYHIGDYCSENNPCGKHTNVGHLWEYVKRNNVAATYVSATQFKVAYHFLSQQICVAHWIHFCRVNPSSASILEDALEKSLVRMELKKTLKDYQDEIAKCVAGFDPEGLEALLAMISISALQEV